MIRYKYILAAISFCGIGSAYAAKIPEDDFVSARTKTAYVEYVQDNVTTRNVIISDIDVGTTGGVISAEIQPAPNFILGVHEGGTAPRITPGALATSNALGITNALASGELNDSISFADHILTARVEEQIATSITPAAGSPGFDLLYSFTLSNMFVELWDHSLDEIPIIGSIDYEIFLNGTKVWSFGASMRGWRDSISIGIGSEVGDFIDGTTFTPHGFTVTGSPGDVPRRVDFDAIIIEDLYLGTITAGTPNPVVDIVMTAGVKLPPLALGAGARANIGDPSALSASLGSFALQPVPLPAAVWMLIGGILALFQFRRSR